MSEPIIKIVRANNILIPTGRILRDYWQHEPYLRENQVSLKALTELSFSVSDLQLSFDRNPPFGWSALSIIEDHLLWNVKGRAHSTELSDDEAVVLQNLTCLANEIHMLVSEMVSQYTPTPAYGYHNLRKWIGNNILIESYS